MVLVTGASGFIGRKLLQPGRVPMVRVASGLFGERVADLRDSMALRRACEGIQGVIHCAGYAHAFSGANDALHAEINLQGTKRLLQAAIDQGVESFVYLSSVKAVGEPGEHCVDESFDALPMTPYGCSKRAAEELVLETGARTGMKVVVLRPVMVYGAGGRGNLQRMASGMRHGWFPRLPETENRRSVVHVHDLTRAIELAVRSTAANGQIYIVAHHKAWSGAAIDRELRSVLGCNLPRWGAPAGIFRMLGGCGDIIGRLVRRPMPINREVIDALLGSACYCSGKIERDLGWRAEIDLPRGLQEMFGVQATV